MVKLSELGVCTGCGLVRKKLGHPMCQCGRPFTDKITVD